jgi:histidine triad (HIT) family protein
MNGSVPEPPADCPFCAIAGGRDTSVEVVHEEADWLAFFPDTPATPGHTLIIPRQHVRDLWAAAPELGAVLGRAVVQVGRAVDAALSPDGMNLISSAGSQAEQTVFHLHLHVVPRWEHDDFGRIWPPKEPMGEDVREGLAAEIRAAFSAG